MVKWIIIFAVVLIVAIFVIRILKIMLKAEKDSNKLDEVQPDNSTYNTFDANNTSINTGSGSNNIVTDMSNHSQDEFGSTFYDNQDTEFNDYRRHARKNGKDNSFPEGFDLEGERSDEYIPDSPEFSYIPRRQQPIKKASIKKELNELSTEMKVLMLSDIFDKKFF